MHDIFIYVAFGSEGVCVYELLDNHYLVLKKYFNKQTFRQPSIDITDIRYNPEGDYIYALDKQNGLHIFRNDVLEYTLKFRGGITFDYYENTFIVVLEENNVHYAIEYYIKFNNR